MKIVKSPVPLLVAFMAAMGLALAFGAPAEARSGHHRAYRQAEFNCPTHGRNCSPEYWARHSRKAGPGLSCPYYDRHRHGYDRYHHGRNYADCGSGAHYRSWR